MVECPRCNTQYDEPPAFCGACGTKMSDQQPLAAPAADPLVGMVIDGRYRIVNLIGRGGMGAVYQVEHVKMGKVMAMKILHGELSADANLIRRFRREAETVSKLNHINTVSVFDFGSHQGMMYLLMEYIDGRDLAEMVRTVGALPFSRVARIMIQVCSALIEAHRKGIVHRDLKPENVLVTHQDGTPDFVKVLDFGLAKLRDVKGKTRLTAQGSLVGTPYYMAPEQIRGETVDRRSDIYALGAVMYKLLTKETPFSANTPMGLITKHLTVDPDAPSKRFPQLNISATADEVVLRAMRKAPGERFQSAEEMRRHLADALEQISPGSEFHRFSSVGDPSWHGGEFDPKSAEQWTMKGSVEMGVADTISPSQLKKKKKISTPPKTANLGRSVIIGAREVEIGTRSDFMMYEQKLRFKRRMALVVPAVLFVAAVLAVGYFLLVQQQDDSVPTVETEPNDSPGEADSLTPSIQLAGFIAKAELKADIDWYRLAGPGTVPWGVDIQVTGVPSLDIALQLVDPQQRDPLATANHQGRDRGEGIGPMVVNQATVYLMVQEVRLPGVPPGNFNQAPYGVTYRIHDASTVEKEPNNSMPAATPTTVGTAVQGVLESIGDVDWFCLPAGAPAQAVQVSGAAQHDVDLCLRVGADPTQTVINQRSIGQGEVAAIPQSEGPICAAVRCVKPSEVEKNPRPIFAPYQIVFQ